MSRVMMRSMTTMYDDVSRVVSRRVALYLRICVSVSTDG